MANVRYVNYDSIGKIQSWGSSDESYLPFIHLNVGELRITGTGTSETHYVLDDEVIERPAVAATNTTRAVDQDWTIPNVPDGTEVIIAGTLAGTTGAFGSLTLAFPAPGLWTVKLDPPWPWIGVEVAVEVTP